MRLTGQSFAEEVDGHRDLLLLDGQLVVLAGLDIVPGQSSLEEVDQHIADTLQVVSSSRPYTTLIVTLLYVDVDASELRLAFDGFLFIFELEVVVLAVQVLLAPPEVNHEYLVLLLPQSREEVVRLDIVVDQSLRVHPLDSFQDLVCDEQDSLQTKGALAVSEELL